MRNPMGGVVFAAILTLTGFHAIADEGGKRIFVYGDSLTWGWTPTAPIVPTTRHPHADRWTTALEEALGEGFELVVDGVSGRTTNIDDPTMPHLNGADYLPAAMRAHEPLDLVIILLGTNDTKTYLDRTPFEVGLGIGELIDIVHKSPGWDWTDYPTPPVLIISPPPLGEKIDPLAAEIFVGAREMSQSYPAVFEAIANAAGENFFDAGSAISTDGIDGIHFTADTNRTLGAAVAEQVDLLLQ